MRSMEFSGRNIDEAIFHGLNEMGLSIDEVDTEIVQKESKGLFGIGAKNAIVRLTEREVPIIPDFEAEKAAAHERKAPVSLTPYSTVTDFARFLGWSTLRPLAVAM